MTDSSSTVNPQLDSSMVDPHRDEEHDQFCDEANKTLSSSMVLSMSRPVSASLPSEPAAGPAFCSRLSEDVIELQKALSGNSSQLNEAENEIKRLRNEVDKLNGDLENKRKLFDESQMNYAHLENCLHEAREEAQNHLCAAERASEYSTLCSSAVKMRGLFERLRACNLSGGTAGFAQSLPASSQSLANAAEFRECVWVLAEKVGALSRSRSELQERCSNVEASNKLLMAECEEKKELVNTLYKKHQLEKQAYKGALISLAYPPAQSKTKLSEICQLNTQSVSVEGNKGESSGQVSAIRRLTYEEEIQQPREITNAVSEEGSLDDHPSQK
ncbi:hypothetical protein DM860_017403 [Cuscuta australis]|uniref:Uncharacterized protein n=1 Tax=Cuscuta australis TaxID=267555 RepID=A0A328D0K9_9ASTE|nr:hypothetical protein DM860_017403 [Cuscuta australis]